MRFSFRLLIVLSLVILVSYSCKKGSIPAPVPVPDTTKPTISFTKPTAGQEFVAGGNIPFQVTFSDNEKLKSYEVAISLKVVGGMILKVVPTSVPFSYTRSSTALTGVKSQEVTITDINIPSNTATTIVSTGIYNVKVTCLDSADNSFSTTLEINMK